MALFGFSTEYFIPLKSYPISYEIPLKCNNSSITDGKIVICDPPVRWYHV